MSLLSVFRTVPIVLLITAFAVANDSPHPGYKNGTVTQNSSSQHKLYDLKDGNNGYEISGCGDFQNGQVVEYRVKDKKVFIREADGKERKCAIEATLETGAPTASAAIQKGTILGYQALYRVSQGSMGGVRRANVYELRGPDLIYLIDFCGSFQAGQFTAGQAVEFRVDGERVYILREKGKEYSCQLEGTQKLESAEETSQPAGSSPAPAAPVAATAKLSITSVPDGADIEVDGDFSGNTPSDLAIAEGEHSITVKKSGYKNWERKMKLIAGSSIHLNAEMEKTTNP